jgi:hypothetical protein
VIASGFRARWRGALAALCASGPSAVSAAASAAPSLGRSAGSFASSCAISASSSGGTSGHSALTRGASLNRILPRIEAALSPSNGGLPVRHSNSTQPSANTSARASITPWLRACSGAM